MLGQTVVVLSILAALFLAQEGSAPVQVDLASKGWYLGTRPIARGDRLSAVAELTAKEAGDLMLECGTGGVILYTCSRVPCRVPACSTEVKGAEVRRLDAGGAPRDLLTRMLPSLIRREPKAPETLGVRGGGSVNDAVLFESGGSLHLGPALRRVLDGRYCFRLKKLPANDSGRTFTLQWDRSVEAEGLVQAAGLTHGVYTLEMGQECVFDDPDRTPVWVVITGQADFARVDGEWKSYAAWLRQLEAGGTTPAAVATLRRAVLSSLGDAVEKP
jgi:hypothetical protein